VHDRLCSKQTQLLEQIDLPLPLHTRFCRKSDDIYHWKKTGTRPPLSSHPNIKGDLTRSSALGQCNTEDSLAVSRDFVASLYDQKAKLRADYSNLNKFRVRLATKKEASLAKLPPCEVTFHHSEFIEIRVICS
jgi:hypothetical protein